VVAKEDNFQQTKRKTGSPLFRFDWRNNQRLRKPIPDCDRTEWSTLIWYETPLSS
jgi:hypothetical protein